MSKNNEQTNTVRPPIVVVMGHVDHGKSTLLDYIRKTNIVDKEAGGITQHISAYEVTHKDEHGANRKITFLDTPGHEAFSKMRSRGANTADIAILVVSAEDSVKAQTIEAWNTIMESKLPYIVAINKIDKPNANIEKAKMDLLEKGIYLEGLGGDVPFVNISAKVGTGVDELLDMILLVADMHSFTGNTGESAQGIIIESHRDPKRGISGTGIIRNGTLTNGMFVVCKDAITSTRMMENFLRKPEKSMTFSSPVVLTGFDKVPEVGNEFFSFATKKEAEAFIEAEKEMAQKSGKNSSDTVEAKKLIPIIIKADVSGTIEAIEKELGKINSSDLAFKILSKSVGNVNESDVKTASIDTDSVILGFNVKIDSNARDLNENMNVNIQLFDIIYKLGDYLKELAEEKRPREEVLEVTGKLKILKTFSATKERQVVGGKVQEGEIYEGSQVRIMRRDFEIGKGKIVGLESNKVKSKKVEEGAECGILVESKIEIAGGDVLEAFKMVVK